MLHYFAPMEGVTDAVYRRAHHECFPGIARYYMPFIAPGANVSLMGRQKKDIAPEANRGVPAVPQVLSSDAESFNGICRTLADMGYTEVDLNLGCPSGTVVGKGRGAGMLRDLDALRRFLDGIFSHPVVPISIKTRIGFSDSSEWTALLALLQDYPLYELIVHLRTKTEFYGGEPHRELISTLTGMSFPVSVNGNLFTASDCRTLAEAHPHIHADMLGRGILTNPALAREADGGAPLNIEDLRCFHELLYRRLLEDWPEAGVIARMHGIMQYICMGFRDAKKQTKAVLRSKTPQEYADAVYRLFDSCELAAPPAFYGSSPYPGHA